MPKFESVAIPFLIIGNRRGLSDWQILCSPIAADFIGVFPHCFERDDANQVWLFIEPEM